MEAVINSKKRVRPSTKGQHKGKALGKTKGKAALTKWIEYGRPKKHIKIPRALDLEDLKKVTEIECLDFESTLMVFHMILHARQTSLKEHQETNWFTEGYGQVHSKKLKDFIGDDYRQYISLLQDHNHIEFLPDAKGRKAYSYTLDKSLAVAVRYRINPDLLQKSKDKGERAFKDYELTNHKLINKLHAKHLANEKIELRKESYKILEEMARKVRFNINKAKEYFKCNPLNENGKAYPCELIIEFMRDINKGELYIKRSFDYYGERFHSSFTFHWGIVRNFMFFIDRPEPCCYLDKKNSQFYFLGNLTKELITEVAPEFKALISTLKKFQDDMNYHSFCTLSRDGKIYEFVRDYYRLNNITFSTFDSKQKTYITYDFNNLHNKGKENLKAGRALAKSILIKVCFSDYRHYRREKKQMKKLFPSLIEFVDQITKAHPKNPLPKLLQILESRILLDRVVVNAVSVASCHNIVSIHDGFIIPLSDKAKFKKCLKEVYSKLKLSRPKITPGYFEYMHEKNYE